VTATTAPAILQKSDKTFTSGLVFVIIRPISFPDEMRDVMHKITLIPGDGIGPDITAATIKVVEASGVEIEWEEVLAGESAIPEFGSPLPENVIESIKRNKIALKGPLTTPVGSGFRSINVALRKELDLYANLRPARTYEGVRSRYTGVDLVVVRENTEDLYAGVEHMVGEDAAESIKIITRKGSERICRFAFEYARKNNRRKVTAVHKANIMKCTDGLFLAVANYVAREYPELEFEDRIVDNMCMQLVIKPEIYDVLVAPNLYGDIISDLCAGLVGGLGLAPGANIGHDTAIFEPVHGSAPKYAGLDRANPTAMILSAVMMLHYIGEDAAAKRIEAALAEVLRKGETVTYDLGGKATGREMSAAIVAGMSL
jgi:isocitrate dehydrogenase (NAD+)